MKSISKNDKRKDSDSEPPKGFEDHRSVQVYVKATKSNDSKHNKLRQSPPKDGKTKPCYWLGQYHATSPSEIWVFPSTKAESDFRGNVHGVYGYNNGKDTALWFLPPNTPPPKSFTPQGWWTLPVQKRDFSSIEPEEAGFLNVGNKVKKIEKLDVDGQWRMLYKRDGEGDEKEPMTIFVKTPKGQRLELEVVPTDTIDHVKDLVRHQKPDIPRDEIRLKFQEKPLEDPSRTLQDCGIEDKDVLDMEPTIVYVRDVDKNKTHTFTVDLEHPISNLKNQIKNKTGTPPNYQRLFFKPKEGELENKHPLRHYGIKHKDVLTLEPMQIHVNTRQGKTLTLTVHPDDTIQNIKNKVEKKENIPVDDQRLAFRGKELNKPKSTLNDNGIHHGDTLDLEPMTIYVRTPGGKKTITFDNVEPTETIRDIKDRVYGEEGIPVGDQRLLFKNRSLDKDNRTLKDYSIAHKDTLDLEGMHIFVKEDWTDRKFKIDVEPQYTVDKVKDLIQDQEGHDKKNQNLLFKGKLLDDTPSLLELGIKHRDVLHLERMKIYVRDWKSKTFALDVDPRETIDSVKQKIEVREGHPKDEQRLFFHSDLLEDSYKSLEHYNIKHKDTLELKKKPNDVFVSPTLQKAKVTPNNSPKGPEYTIGLSPWSDPLSPAGYSPKKKIARNGTPAKSKELLKNRYHADLAADLRDLSLLAEQKYRQKKADEAAMK
ncbi:ubiquitin [Nitzschia inconspicua]|uniref:Ubiquitin n=1 Tax=Nitzschia inconspicua TaxID=303405 RepID=A0A9K3PTF0_9STRA|nr:ubiquitin [Nitzschia inconspicua]